MFSISDSIQCLLLNHVKTHTLAEIFLFICQTERDIFQMNNVSCLKAESEAADQDSPDGGL